jgi:hypothetical protein
MGGGKNGGRGGGGGFFGMAKANVTNVDKNAKDKVGGREGLGQGEQAEGFFGVAVCLSSGFYLSGGSARV